MNVQYIKKKFLKQYLLLIFLCWSGINIYSQTKTNMKTKFIKTSRDTIVLDSMIIFPSSFIMKHGGLPVDNNLYKLDINKGILILSKNLRLQYSSVEIKYRILNLKIAENKKSEKFKLIDGFDDNNRLYRYTKTRLLTNKTSQSIHKEGTYTRGFTFGSNQDVMLNSKLDLRLNGVLKDSLMISAVINDNQIPFQAEGNTQKLQEFDKIYIKIYEPNQELLLGDYFSKNDEGAFLKFSKKSQGAQYMRKSNLANKNILTTGVNLAIAKGKYNKLIIKGIEGNQGPYKLYGVNNEQYIIVLSDSEKIYLDGVKMIRGTENDYTINYNTSEIEFTSKRIINGNSRIIVEYEYSEENYTRYFMYSKNRLKTKKYEIWVDAYGEKDDKNKNLVANFSDREKEILKNLGDSDNKLLVSNVDSVAYQAYKILYKKLKIYILDKEYITYKYSTHKDSAHYKLKFIFLGENKGNYIALKSQVNGKIYEWVSPKQGIMQGSYTINRRLIAAQSHNIIDAGILFNLSDKFKSSIEFSFSNKDKNTFSNKDDKNNKGIALLWKTENITYIRNKNIKLINSLDIEYISSNYQNLISHRDIEFSRNWNINNNIELTNESFINSKNKLVNKKWGFINCNLSYLKRGSLYNASKQDYGLNYTYKKLSLTSNIDWLNSYEKLFKTSFLRTHILLKYKLGKASISVKRSSEDNKYKEGKNLLLNSFSNETYSFIAEKKFNDKTYINFSFTERKNFIPKENSMQIESKSKDLLLEVQIRKTRKNSIKANINYRLNKYINIDSKNINKQEKTFIGRIEHKLRIKKSFIYSSTFYELGSGLEAKKEIQYIETAAGMGNYIWIDYNKNEIQELNEFELAKFKDQAKYIKINIPGKEYTKVYTKQYRQSIHIKPRALLGLKNSFLKYFSNKLNLRIKEKTSNSDLRKYWNPLVFKASHEDIIYSSYINNTLSYSSKKRKLRIDYIYKNNTDKQELSNTIISNKISDDGLLINYKSNNYYVIRNKTNIGSKKRKDLIFEKKSYNIEYLKNIINLKLQCTSSLQIGLEYYFAKEKNKLGEELMYSHNLGCDVSSVIKKKSKVRLTYNFVMIKFTDYGNQSINYAMLAGLQAGNNSLWSVSYRQKVSKLFNINISYNGRKSSDMRIIHNASMEIRASF